MNNLKSIEIAGKNSGSKTLAIKSLPKVLKLIELKDPDVNLNLRKFLENAVSGDKDKITVVNRVWGKGRKAEIKVGDARIKFKADNSAVNLLKDVLNNFEEYLLPAPRYALTYLFKELQNITGLKVSTNKNFKPAGNIDQGIGDLDRLSHILSGNDVALQLKESMKSKGVVYLLVDDKKVALSLVAKKVKGEKRVRKAFLDSVTRTLILKKDAPPIERAVALMRLIDNFKYKGKAYKINCDISKYGPADKLANSKVAFPSSFSDAIKMSANHLIKSSLSGQDTVKVDVGINTQSNQWEIRIENQFSNLVIDIHSSYLANVPSDKRQSLLLDLAKDIKHKASLLLNTDQDTSEMIKYINERLLDITSKQDSGQEISTIAELSYLGGSQSYRLNDGKRIRNKAKQNSTLEKETSSEIGHVNNKSDSNNSGSSGDFGAGGLKLHSTSVVDNPHASIKIPDRNTASIEVSSAAKETSDQQSKGSNFIYSSVSKRRFVEKLLVVFPGLRSLAARIRSSFSPA